MFDPWLDVTTENREHKPDDKTHVANTEIRPVEEATMPATIGRYRIERLLGEGAFGLVFLAFDEQLHRLVAVKVPHARLVSRPEDAELYLREARAVASLDHPNIVPVYDVGGTDQFPCYVVSKFIDGQTLSSKLGGGPFTCREAAELVATMAEALHHAHQQGLVHRDIKPGNILIDPNGKPFVLDFGLALREADLGTGPRYAGTPSYMSPEQAWGEGHRVDGRSDVFSLGIVLYLLLVGRLPFQGSTREELMEQITSHEPRPSRQIDNKIPRELDRICLRALAKRASERYSTAYDMAEDLRFYLAGQVDDNASTGGSHLLPSLPPATPPSVVSSNPTLSLGSKVKIVPKGLRSFDENDADFFLELLPGPRDRDGLPESLRFWKRWIEVTDPDKTAPVGLIYGPSGCGKSSLVKAGLIPRLSDDILTVYIEATPNETEARLRSGLKNHFPDVPENLGLRDTLAALRRSQALPAGKKVLIVLDQFEQWLHGRREDENSLLIQALRQCDGQRVQCLVMVRDDFWMAATRFMRALEIRLLEGQNSAAVDLFDPTHARKVLASFGRAFGRLPRNSSDQTRDKDHTYKDQENFLKEAVAGLAHEGKIVCVRLALFAEMMKGKPWTRATLSEVGGSRGVGFTFLEENFSAATATREHRYHQQAARSVLKALLPDSGTDIKGHMRSYAELLEACGYEGRREDFDDLIRILDAELRLITPTDPEGVSRAQEDPPKLQAVERYYQLTHDYLVHSLRDWLTRKQRETRRGRAELLLAERSQLWNSKPENRFLPSPWEWANLQLLTTKKDWTEPQHAMMRRAGRVHGLIGIAALGLIAAGTWGVIEAQGNLWASGMVGSLKTARTADVPSIIKQLSGYRRWADPPLRRLLKESYPASREYLHASMAMLAEDPSQVDYLTDSLLSASATELPVLGELLEPHQSKIAARLWSVLDTARPGEPTMLAAASALARYAPKDPRWTRHAEKIAELLVRSNPLSLGSWLELFRPARAALVAPLAAILRDRAPLRTESERELAATLLSDYASTQPDALADLLMDADPTPFATLLPVAQRQAEKVRPTLLAEISKTPGSVENAAQDEAANRLAARQARGAAALIHMDQARDVMPLLRNSTDPRLRCFLINWLRLLGVNPQRLASELEHLNHRSAPFAGQGKIATATILLHPETSIRRALILALGKYPTKDLTPELLKSLTTSFLVMYRDDPDCGIHGALEWTLREWGLDKEVRKIELDLMQQGVRSNRRWFVNSQRQTLAIIDGPVEFVMGSAPSEPHHSEEEKLHKRIIPRRFAIATKEVSTEQFEEFLKEHPVLCSANAREFSPDPQCPASKPSWYAAAAFCNWLSKREKLSRCYEPAHGGLYADGMMVPADVLTRTGYRLPTEAEWEFASRAGSLTSSYCGTDWALLSNYAYFNLDSDGRAWPCGSLLPNDLGLFDMLGNLYEWCQDPQENYKPGPAGVIVDQLSEADSVVQGKPRILRGGGFVDVPGHLRSAQRSWNTPHNQLGSYGFRIARTQPP
jgi:eukaryotic-like serine/threonine-protein kinase